MKYVTLVWIHPSEALNSPQRDGQDLKAWWNDFMMSTTPCYIESRLTPKRLSAIKDLVEKDYWYGQGSKAGMDFQWDRREWVDERLGRKSEQHWMYLNGERRDIIFIQRVPVDVKLEFGTAQ